MKRSPGSPPEDRSDYLVQGRLHHESKTHPEKVRARLPKSLHRDYESWLEDRAAAGR
jgi:hypothetical protein